MNTNKAGHTQEIPLLKKVVKGDVLINKISAMSRPLKTKNISTPNLPALNP
jgi:hypothetical protein